MKEKGQPDLACFGLGHATCQGGTLPLNAFGQDFKAAGYKWTKEICQKDSDGDGQTNGEVREKLREADVARTGGSHTQRSVRCEDARRAWV
jgi:hypothetical protein